MPWGEQEKIFSKINIFFIFVMLVVFIMIFMVTTAIFERNLPEASKNCVAVIEDQPLYTCSSTIKSGTGAKEALADYLNGDVTFIGTLIENCGIGYTFNTSEKIYMICGNCEIYEYSSVCKDYTLAEKFFMSLGMLKYFIAPQQS